MVKGVGGRVGGGRRGEGEESRGGGGGRGRRVGLEEEKVGTYNHKNMLAKNVVTLPGHELERSVA